MSYFSIKVSRVRVLFRCWCRYIHVFLFPYCSRLCNLVFGFTVDISIALCSFHRLYLKCLVSLPSLTTLQVYILSHHWCFHIPLPPSACIHMAGVMLYHFRRMCFSETLVFPQGCACLICHWCIRRFKSQCLYMSTGFVCFPWCSHVVHKLILKSS